MTIKLKLLPPSAMKAKAATHIAGQVIAGSGITVTKAAGSFTVAVDVPGLGLDALQPIDSDLTALANNSTSGFWTRTGTGTGAARTLTGTANEITVTNGSGVAGNPTFSLFDTNTFIYAAKYGVVADGSTDDTTALSSAITAAMATGKTLLLPVGDIKISSGFTLTSAIAIVGSGCGGSTASPAVGGTKIKPTGAMTVFTVNTPYGCTFRDFAIEFPGATPSTANCTGIRLTDSSTENSNSRIEGMHFSYCSKSIDTVKAMCWVVDKCVFYSNSICVNVVNGYDADHGDSFITNCSMVMTTGLDNIYGIYQQSSGGLKVCNNKIVGGAYAYVMALESASENTSILLFANNSIEGTYRGTLLFTRAAGETHTFQYVVITGNQIGSPSVAGPSIYVPANADGTWIYDFAITGNVFVGPVGTVSVINIDKVDGYCISGNTFLSGDATSRCITTGADALHGIIGANSKRGTFAADVFGGTTVTPAVIGPNTQTANGVPRWSSTIGTLKSTGITIDDSDNIASAGTYNGVTINNSAWTTGAPTVTSETSSLTTVSAAARYQQRGKTLQYSVVITITTAGGGGGAILCPLPGGMTTAGGGSLAGVRGDGKALATLFASGATALTIRLYDATTAIASSSQYFISGVIELA